MCAGDIMKIIWGCGVSIVAFHAENALAPLLQIANPHRYSRDSIELLPSCKYLSHQYFINIMPNALAPKFKRSAEAYITNV